MYKIIEFYNINITTIYHWRRNKALPLQRSLKYHLLVRRMKTRFGDRAFTGFGQPAGPRGYSFQLAAMDDERSWEANDALV